MDTRNARTPARRRTGALAAATLVAVALCLAAGASKAGPVLATEFYDLAHDRYFLTADPVEVALLGRAPFEAWYRTGVQFYVDDAPGPGRSPVCRFFSAAFGKPTHFFTADAGECAALKQDPRVAYEGIAFHVPMPDATGACSPGSTPVYRLYSALHDGSPSHVYTPYRARADRFAGYGFTLERVAFCVPSSADLAAAKTARLAGTLWHIQGYPARGGFSFGGGPVDLALGTTVRSTPMTESPQAFQVSSALDAYLYASDSGEMGAEVPRPVVMGWDPLTGRYSAFDLAFAYYMTSGDRAGGIYAIDWEGGPDAESCASYAEWIVGDDGAPDPLQPFVIRNDLDILCRGAKVEANP